MKGIQLGRLTVDNQHDLVVFIIGARVNRWWLLPLSLPILARMQKMLRELAANPDSGLLGVQPLGFGGMVQYWKSLEHLQAYAHDRNQTHRPAWTQFFQKLFKNVAAGVWHETFAVRAGQYEAVYVNMPRRGMGHFQTLIPAEGGLHTMKGRLPPVRTSRVG